jgi:hypothetical protein
MDTDLYDDRLTKISDLSFKKNPALGTLQKSAVLSERSNQNKN